MKPLKSSRRRFLSEVAGLACAPAFFPGLSLQKPTPERPKSLVLLELFGGVDSLGVLVPRDDDEYHRIRPTLSLPSNSLLPFDDERGFPAYMAGLHQQWHEGNLRIIEGVGYPNYSMSHFAARIIWGAGYPNHSAVANGWIARLRRHLWKDDPRPELLTHVGDELAHPLRAAQLPVLCFDDPTSMDWIASCCQASEAGSSHGEEGHAGDDEEVPEILADLRGTLSLAHRLGPRLREIVTEYSPQVEYPQTDFGRHLRTIAGMIQGGFGSRVYSLKLTGFDMHARDTKKLFRGPTQFAEGINAFMNDLRGTSAFEETLVLCCSEMGRRAAENSAGGSDHGAAGLTFLLGGKLEGGLSGKRPSIVDLDVNGNLIPSLDYRRIYAAVIEQWFEADHVPVMFEKLEVPKLI